jgi:hypothetical protein
MDAKQHEGLTLLPWEKPWGGSESHCRRVRPAGQWHAWCYDTERARDRNSDGWGWAVRLDPRERPLASGPETGQAGRAKADEALARMLGGAGPAWSAEVEAEAGHSTAFREMVLRAVESKATPEDVAAMWSGEAFRAREDVESLRARLAAAEERAAKAEGERDEAEGASILNAKALARRTEERDEAIDLLDEWDRYGSAEYFGSPFAQTVGAYLRKHGRRDEANRLTEASAEAMARLAALRGSRP